MGLLFGSFGQGNELTAYTNDSEIIHQVRLFSPGGLRLVEAAAHQGIG
jgi:hypothetical protein